MIQKKLIFTFLLFANIFCVFPQSEGGPAVNIQSPDVAKMFTSANIDVNYYTGRPQISLPIYTITDGDLSIPITLNYYSGGVKMDEVATKVGLGWDLNVGGAVIRNIRGLPDEISRGYSNLSGDYLKFNKYMRDVSNRLGLAYFSIANLTGITPEEKQAYSFYDEWIHNRVDISPDAYSFSFMGYTGHFVYPTPGGRKTNPIMQTDSKVKLKCIDYACEDTDQHDMFVDIDGYTYDFREKIIILNLRRLM